MNKQKKDYHLQVLVTDEMKMDLNRVINLTALQTGEQTKSLSAYVRSLIEADISKHQSELDMYKKGTAKAAAKI